MRAAEYKAPPTTHEFIMAGRCAQDASTTTYEVEPGAFLLARPSRDVESAAHDTWLELAERLAEVQSGSLMQMFSLLSKHLLEPEEISPQEPVETEGAFDKLDQIKKAETRQVLDNIRKIPIENAERIYSRLLSLVENAEEEYPDEELVSVSSLRGFEKFLKSEYQWKYPDIVVSPEGNIVVEWFEDKNHHVAIEFIGQATAKLVMLVPDIKLKSKVVPVVTKPRVESIPEAVKPYDVLSWVTQ